MPRLAELVARYGDEFNLLSASPDEAPAASGRVRAACQRVGRDPDELVYSAMTGVLVAETEVDLRARVSDLMEALGRVLPTGRPGWRSDEDARSWAPLTRRASVRPRSSNTGHGALRLFLVPVRIASADR